MDNPFLRQNGLSVGLCSFLMFFFTVTKENYQSGIHPPPWINSVVPFDKFYTLKSGERFVDAWDCLIKACA